MKQSTVKQTEDTNVDTKAKNKPEIMRRIRKQRAETQDAETRERKSKTEQTRVGAGKQTEDDRTSK